MATPQPVYNRPQLSEITYRAGTHADFLKSMLLRLSTYADDYSVLSRLLTRDSDDFTIALLDAWATVSDVLTFYQERIANESYIRTARERLSLLYLARMIGYELSPGVASELGLAFNVDKEVTKTMVPAGTQVQSIPTDGGAPQTFETSEPIEARSAWNKIKPRLTQRHPLPTNDSDSLLDNAFYFAGISTGIKVGDGVLIVPETATGGNDDEPIFRLVGSVKALPKQKRTEVMLLKPPERSGFIPMPYIPVAFNMATPSLVVNSLMMANTATASPIFSEGYLIASSLAQNFTLPNIFQNLYAIQDPPLGVMAMRERAYIFGHNAPKHTDLPSGDTTLPPDTEWVDKLNVATCSDLISKTNDNFSTRDLYLDRVYDKLTKDSWIVLLCDGKWQNYRVLDVNEVSLSRFTLNAKVTRVTLDNDGLAEFSLRNTTVYCVSELMPLARLPVTKPVTGADIELEGWVDGISAAKHIVVCGELVDDRGNRACELARIADVEHIIAQDGYSRINLEAPLKNDYVRDEHLLINANVALATHGETKHEILGSGNGRDSFQKFVLKHNPLTYTSAASASGVESTLQIRIDDIEWEETQDLERLGPLDKKFITRHDDDGNTQVMFGDGIHGARLPTGTENIKAHYRSGIGTAGNVGADTVTLLTQRPAGILEVTNPVAATGGDSAESRDQARTNAPLKILTLDRIVSFQDYEDFASAFAGISKAMATWSWFGETRGVFVTVAGPDGTRIEDDSAVRNNLLTAMRAVGDPNIPVHVASYVPVLFQIKANVIVKPEHDVIKVRAAVRDQLRESLSFTARDIGKGLHKSEIVAMMHQVKGVEAVEFNELKRNSPPQVVEDYLPANMPQPSEGENSKGAELLMLDIQSVDLGASYYEH